MRLIDADTLKAEFTGNFNEMWHYTGVRAVIDVAPTIEAEPVSHELNEQIKWERDVAIGQLNDLGYGFGEKIQEASYKTKYQQLLQDVHDYQGSICCYCKNYSRNNCEYFGDLPHEDGIPLSCGKFMWRHEEIT